MSKQVRSYVSGECVVFCKTREAFGGLSNMAAGFPLVVNGHRIPGSEALYQACRFPHQPEVQRLIVAEANPMRAKAVSRAHLGDSRPDWEQVRVRVMRWCLQVKLAQHWDRFGGLLLATGDRPIVELSYKDDFWGAKPVNGQVLVGVNALGRLLMELREAARSGGHEASRVVESPEIPDLQLFGQPVGPVPGA